MAQPSTVYENWATNKKNFQNSNGLELILTHVFHRITE